MMERAHNWQYLFNPVAGSIQGRNDDGSFPPGPAFQTSLFEPGGEVGFEEGNAAQYTWSVPQDLSALSSLMGGNARTVSALDLFFTQLNAGRYLPYDWSGNEPSLWTPWEYDYFGAPSSTQAVVRAIVNTQYADAPVDEPGNDDLGAISSWYVWAAIGLYPVTPGTADLSLASPLFPRVDLTLPDGNRVVMRAPAASDALHPHPGGQRRPCSQGNANLCLAHGIDPKGSGELELALAPLLHHHDRRDTRLRAFLRARSLVGVSGGGQSPVIRYGPAAGRWVLRAERWPFCAGGADDDGAAGAATSGNRPFDRPLECPGHRTAHLTERRRLHRHCHHRKGGPRRPLRVAP
jgi:hypothetical protein